MSETPNEPQSATADDESQERTPVVGTVTDDRVVIVTRTGMGVADREPAETADDDATEAREGREGREQRQTNPADLVEEPAKVMRIGAMIKQLLEEVRGAPLDDKGRARLAEIHSRSIAELKDGLAPELVQELERIALPFSDEAPSDAELRIAQAQLVGWLEGLFHGIQTALVAQQMAAQAQLQQMRALPPGHPAAQTPPGMPSAPDGGPKSPNGGTGQYL